MALIKCPECGKSISESAISCPNCGYEFENNRIKKRKQINEKIFQNFGISIVVILALWMMNGFIKLPIHNAWFIFAMAISGLITLIFCAKR